MMESLFQKVNSVGKDRASRGAIALLLAFLAALALGAAVANRVCTPLPSEAYAAEDASGGPLGAAAIEAAASSPVTPSASPSISLSVHLRGKGWAKAAPANNQTAIDAFSVKLDPGSYKGSVKYRSHVGSDWQARVENGATSGKISKRTCLDAVEMRLTGAIAAKYDVAYRVKTKDAGWQSWVSGRNASCKPSKSPVIALQVRLVKRPSLPAASGYGHPVANGLYSLSPATASSLGAGAAGASLVRKANVELGKKSSRAFEQKWLVTWKGSGYEVMNANSGFVLEAAGAGKNLFANVRQAKRTGSASQRWYVKKHSDGTLAFVSAATGTVLAPTRSTLGSMKSTGMPADKVKSGTNVGLVLANRTAAGDSLAVEKAQRWRLKVCKVLPSAGLFEVKPRAATKLRLDVFTGSLASGASVQLIKRNGGNNQKFAIVEVKKGAYRIGSSFGDTALTVAGGSGKTGAKMSMDRWRGVAAQLWIPTVTSSGIGFKNKKSGKFLSFSAAKSGDYVCQAPSGSAAWVLSSTKINKKEQLSPRNAIYLASGGGLRMNGKIAGHSVSEARWNRLKNALNRCKAQGISVGFVMVDLNTGFTVGRQADRARFGASTVKGLYVTYLFEEYLEKGRLSWGAISGLASRTIVWSDNNAYRTLRARYGSESGFNRWLARAGMSFSRGYSGTLWGDYSARQLALGWTRMAGYVSSGGKYVKTWKRLFSRSDHSFIHEALGGSCSTYTKPGWMFGGSWSGTIMNDAGIVDDGHGRRYLLSFVTNANPYSRHLVGRVVSALDSIDRSLPKTRVQ